MAGYHLWVILQNLYFCLCLNSILHKNNRKLRKFTDFFECENLNEDPKLGMWECWVRTCVVVLVTASESVEGEKWGAGTIVIWFKYARGPDSQETHFQADLIRELKQWKDLLWVPHLFVWQVQGPQADCYPSLPRNFRRWKQLASRTRLAKKRAP